MESAKLRNNIKSTYETFLKVKSYPSILKPMHEKIRSVGLHWDSHRLRLISKYLKYVKKYLDNDITESELREKTNNFDDCIYEISNGIFNLPCKTKEEIDASFERANKSKKTKIKILNLIKSKDLIGDDIRELQHKLIVLSFDEHKKEYERCSR